MPGIPIGGLGSPPCYLITRGYGFVEKDAAGWADDHVRDPIVVATPGAVDQVGFNQWRPRTAAAEQARMTGLYRLESPRWGSAGGYALRAELSALAHRNLDLTVRVAAVNHAVGVVFDPGVNMPPIPASWVPDDVRAAIDAAVVAAVGAGGPYAELEDAANGTGRLSLVGWSTAAGDGILVEATSDPWVLSILGFHAGRIALAPQPNDSAFNEGGPVSAGLEIHGRGDGVYCEVNNRPLLNLSEDVRTLRREILLLRDGIDEGWPLAATQAAMTGPKVLDGPLMFPPERSFSSPPNCVVRGGTGQPFDMALAEIYYAKLPEVMDPWNSPLRMAVYDAGGYSFLVDSITFEDHVADGPPSNWGWGVFARNFFTGGAPVGIFWHGGEFNVQTVTTSAPYAPGADLDTTVNAIRHDGASFSVQTYHQPSAATVTNIAAFPEMLLGQIYDDVFTAAVLGPAAFMHRGYMVYVTAEGDVVGGGAPRASAIFYRPDMSGAAVPMPAPYPAPTFAYEFMFLGGPPRTAYFHGESQATTWLATAAGARIVSHTGDRDYHQFSVRDLAGTAAFDTLTTARNASGFVQESSPGAPAVPIFCVYTQDFAVGGPAADVPRVEVEGRFSADTPYALRLMHEATENIQTELVFAQRSISRRVAQWQEGTGFEVWVDVVRPLALTRLDTVTHAIPSYTAIPAPIGGAFMVSTVAGVDVLMALEMPSAGTMPYSGTGQAVVVGNQDDSFKMIGLNNPNGWASWFAWDVRTKRPRAYASAADPARTVGSILVHRGGAANKIPDGEVADLYRVFSPEDYWWDISEAVTRTYGVVQLSAAVAVPSWAAPVKLYQSVAGVGRGERFCCALVERDPTTPPTTYRYRYVMEGARLAPGDVVWDGNVPGVPVTVISVSYQPRGTIILKPGRYLARHRLYLAAPAVGVFAIGDCVEQLTGPAAIGYVVEADAAGNWIDVAASVGRWEEGRNVDLVVGPAGPFALSYVVYPIDFSKPSRLITGETNWAVWKHCRIGADVRVVGEGGAEIVGYGGVVRLRNDTTASGFFPGVEQMVGDSADNNFPARMAYGDYMGLRFENVSFGGVIMKTYSGGRNVLSGYNCHGVVVSDAYPASFHNSYWYGISFDRCVFQDRIVWIHDDASWLLLSPPDRRSVGVSVRDSLVDTSYMFGVDELAGVLVDYPHDLLDDYCLWDFYGHNTVLRSYGPALDGCLFGNVRIEANRMPKTGYKHVLPFVVPSMVDVRMENVVEGIETKNIAPRTPAWYFDERAAHARCDYFVNVAIEGCRFRETPLWMGAVYATIAYDAAISGSVSVGDMIVTSGCAVGTILGFETTAIADDTAVCRLERSWLYLPGAGSEADGGVLAWIDPAQNDKDVNFSAGVSVTSFAYRHAQQSKGSAGLVLTSEVGAVRVHGAYDTSYVYSNGDLLDGQINRRVRVEGCSFSSGSRARAAASPLAMHGGAADFVLCGNVTFGGNRVGITFDAYSVGAGPYDERDQSFSCVVSASGCRRFRAEENVFVAINAPQTSGTAVVSKRGCDLSIYTAYACDEFESRGDDVRDVNGGDGYCHNNCAAPAGGGAVAFATLVMTRAYRVAGAKVRDVGTGSAAGAGTSVYARGGDFSLVRDVPTPGDCFQSDATPSATYYTHFAACLEDLIEAEVESCSLSEVYCADGSSISAAHAKNINCGRGGNAFGWFGSSYSSPSCTYDRGWRRVNVAACQFDHVWGGDGGSATIGDHAGGAGGTFEFVYAYLGNARIRGGITATGNRLLKCDAGSGGDGHGVNNGGSGGECRGLHVYGPSQLDGGARRDVAELAFDANSMILCYGGAAGNGVSDGSPGGFSAAEVKGVAHTDGALIGNYAGVSVRLNDVIGCSPGTGECGFYMTTWNGLAIADFDFASGSPTMPNLGRAWSLLLIDIGGVDAISASDEGYFDSVEVIGNKFMYDNRVDTTMFPDNACMTALLVRADLAYKVAPVTDVWWPIKRAKVASNTRAFDTASLLVIRSAILLVTNSMYSPAGLKYQVGLAERQGLDFVIENNSWGIEDGDPSIHWRHVRDHVMLPAWQQLPPPRMALQLYTNSAGVDDKWQDFADDAQSAGGVGFSLLMAGANERLFITDDRGQTVCIKDGASETGAVGVDAISSYIHANPLLGGGTVNILSDMHLANMICGIFRSVGVEASFILIPEDTSAIIPRLGSRLVIVLDKCSWGKISFLYGALVPSADDFIPLRLRSLGASPVTLQMEVTTTRGGTLAARRSVRLDSPMGANNIYLTSWHANPTGGLEPCRGIVIKGNT